MPEHEPELLAIASNIYCSTTKYRNIDVKARLVRKMLQHTALQLPFAATGSLVLYFYHAEMKVIPGRLEPRTRRKGNVPEMHLAFVSQIQCQASSRLLNALFKFLAAMQLSAIAFSTFAALVALAALAALPQGEATGCKRCPIKLHDARGDVPDPFLTCVRDGKTINLCDYNVTAEDISLVYEPCNVDKLESVKFRVDGEEVNCEEHEPYTINENDGDNFFPWSAPLGEIELTVSGYTSHRCRDRINKERLTFTLVEECKLDCKCDDSNMCTTDTCASDGSCVFTPSVHCPYKMSCDPADGVCKKDDELVPCVAVIDEDSSFGLPNQFESLGRVSRHLPQPPFLSTGPR